MNFVSSLADSPWDRWAIAILARSSLVFVVAWVAHAALRGASPRWRILVWRAAGLATLAVAILAAAPAVISLEVLPESSTTRAAMAPARESLAVAKFAAPVSTTDTLVHVGGGPADRPGDAAKPSNPQRLAEELAARISVSSDRRGRLALWLWIAWFVGLALACGRFFREIWCYARVSRAAAPASEAIRVIAAEVAARCLYRGKLDLRCTTAPIGPCLAGIFRPAILLPVALCRPGAERQARNALAHELAHLAGRDLPWNALLTLLSAVFWFHPLAWRLRRAHADACDERCDAVATTATADVIGYGQLLARVALQMAGQAPALTLPMARSPHVLRRISMLPHGRGAQRLPKKRVLPAVGLFVLLTGLLGSVAIERRQAAASPPAEASNPSRAGNEQSGQLVESAPREFQLLVVDKKGKPLSQLEVEVSARPELNDASVVRGELVRRRQSAIWVKTDDSGILTLRLTKPLDYFCCRVQQPGFGLYDACWDSTSHQQDLPRNFTMELDDAWSVGGVVVNDEGEPVVGAKVRPSIAFKRRPGDREQLHNGAEAVTDEQGAWRFDSVSTGLTQVDVELRHADYQPTWETLGRTVFEVKPGAPLAKIALSRGLSIRGTVTDVAGTPIEGAVVRTKFANDVREAVTDAAGGYVLTGCQAAMTRVVASADGKALELKTVRVEPNMDPVDFQLQPGGKVRIRVVDEHGKGIPKARIFFQRWRGRIDYFEFDHVDQYADDNGVWEWDGAPLDEFQADICRPDGMQLSQQKLQARDEEYVFSPPPALVVSGRVVDKATQRPVDKFRVIPGLRNADPGIQFNWIQRDAYDATDGNYQIRLTHGYPAHLVRVEADGYQVAISRDIRTDEGNVRIDFELEPAANIESRVVTAAGRPAAGAKIALGVAGSQISIESGEIDDGQTYATRLETDDDGRFQIPARDEAFQIVITHPEGFAHLKSTGEPIDREIVLTPWARIEGTYRVGRTPQPNVVLSVYAEGIHSFGPDVPNIFSTHDVTTGENGEFVIERAFPGPGRIGRRIVQIVDQGAIEVTSSLRAYGEFPSGATTRLDIGGAGAAVIGRLAPPPGRDAKPMWNFALIRVESALRAPPRPEGPPGVKNDAEEYEKWWNRFLVSPEGLSWRASYASFEAQKRKLPVFDASVASDGTFRIDDVPSGTYELDVQFMDRPVGVLRNYAFTVDAEENGAIVDLGEIVLQ